MTLKNRREVYPPLKVLQDYAHIGLKSWAEIDTIRDTLKNLGQSWDESIYIPSWCIWMGISMLGDDNTELSFNTLNSLSILSAALTSWRRCKEVYRFHAEMEQMLYEQGTDCRFPVEILRHLPYPCIYLETPELGNKEYHGFFVYLDQKMDKSMFMLRFIGISKEGAIRDNYDLELKKSEDIISVMELEIVKIMAMMKLENKWSSDELMQKMEERKTILLGLVQLLLYICAENADLERFGPSLPTVSTAVVRPEITEQKVIKDKYHEIEAWNVGYRVVKSIKATVQAENNQSTTVSESGHRHRNRKRPRPHLRRGHWHLFRIGKRTMPEQQRLILHWLSPIPVNIKRGQETELPVVINSIDRN